MTTKHGISSHNSLYIASIKANLQKYQSLICLNMSVHIKLVPSSSQQQKQTRYANNRIKLTSFLFETMMVKVRLFRTTTCYETFNNNGCFSLISQMTRSFNEALLLKAIMLVPSPCNRTVRIYLPSLSTSPWKFSVHCKLQHDHEDSL